MTVLQWQGYGCTWQNHVDMNNQLTWLARPAVCEEGSRSGTMFQDETEATGEIQSSFQSDC